MFEIWHPRYKDKTVLLMTSKLKSGQDAKVTITCGEYAGKYTVKAEDLAKCNTELKPNANGRIRSMTIVPLSMLIKEN